MNDTLYQDGFSQTFDAANTFFDFLDHVEKNSQWQRIDIHSLQVAPLNQFSSVPGLSVDIIADTMKNTGLLLRLGDNQLIPLRDCAIKSLQNRAKISGPALRKVRPDQLAQIFNYCLDVSKSLALVRISSGKVSAVLSGDPHDYAILDAPELFQLTHNYLTDNYNGQFVFGSFEHHLTTALWSLNDPQLLETYQQALIDYGQTPGKLTAAVYFCTSNIGTSSAKLYPYLLYDNFPLALGEPLALAHKGNATVADFKSRLDRLFMHYKQAIDSFSKLLNTPISYPAQTMIHIAKALGLPHKLCMPVIGSFAERTGNTPCTAHDCYYQLNEIIYQEQCQGASPSKILERSETIMGALTLNWPTYDYYSDIAW